MKPRKVIITGLVAVAVMLTATWAQARAQQGHIELKSMAQQEKEIFNEEGKKEVQRVPAAKVLPGDEVIFTTTYENISQESAENAAITNPVPEHMFYQADTAAGVNTAITFSVDGGKSYDHPRKLFIRDSAGKQYPARPQDYTHIRWTFENPLPSGTKGEVSFRAILE